MLNNLFDLNILEELKNNEDINKNDDIVINTKKIVNKDIAVIGIAGKFADADNVDEYWSNLLKGHDSIRHIPDERKIDSDIFFKALYNSTLQEKGISFMETGYMNDIDKFDYGLFSLSPREASLMDPNQRIFLETAFTAVEDAGYGGEKIKSTRTGVFVGHSTDFGEDYKKLVKAVQPTSEGISLAGNIKSIIASRISYLLDIKGPSMVIDTACSSGLMAVHLACKSIISGECTMALAGAVKVNLLPVKEVHLRNIGIESSDDRAKTFDENSDGTGMGEGVVVILLKSYQKALEDRDNIYGIIKGSAINQDGNSNGITAPNPAAQEEVILRAWKNANIEPRSITYIETHGTGTKLGDPIEVEAIKRAFNKYTDEKQFCALGAVKTNIGHLDHGSGMAGLVKTILCLKNKRIPGNLHFNSPNKKIDFIDSPVFINDINRKWNKGKYPRRCGVSAFGLSGTNCHVVLEEAPYNQDNINKKYNEYNIFILSAQNENLLLDYVKKYNDYLRNNKEIDILNLCYTVSTGRDHFDSRLAIIIRNFDELFSSLEKIINSGRLDIDEDNIFYKHHKIVSMKKKMKSESEITEEERKQITKKANELVKSVSINKIVSKYLSNICNLYISGAIVNWEELYHGVKAYRINLPTYPFMKNRCWVKADNNAIISNYNTNEDLLNGPIIDSFNIDIYYSKLDVDRHWFLNEHKVGDIYVVPGTTYIDMASKIAKKYFSEEPFQIQNLIYISPLAVNKGETKEVQIIVKKLENGKNLALLVASKDENDNWIKHTEFNIINIPKHEEINDEYINIKTTGQVTNSKEFYKKQRQVSFMKFGERWTNVTKLYSTQYKYLAKIEIDNKYIKDLDGFNMHPAMLDYALNFLNRNFGNDEYLPLSCKSFNIYGSTPKRFYSLIEIKNKNNNNLETITFDITLLNIDGEVFGKLQDYVIKKVNKKSFNLNNKRNSKDIYQTFKWIKEDKPTTNNIKENSELFVVIHNTNYISQSLCSMLKANSHKIVEVNISNRYKKINENKYILSGSQSDYTEFFKNINEDGYSNISILHMLNIYEKDVIDVDELQECKERGIINLFNLSKGLISSKIQGETNTFLIANNCEEVTGKEDIILPHNNAFMALGKVITNEYKNIYCRAIDIDINSDATEIYYEIFNKENLYNVAYRERGRFKKVLDNIKSENFSEKKIKLSQDGIYIITGGTGGIGIELTKNLSKEAKINIALVNRSKFPEKSKWQSILQENKDKKLCKKIKDINSILENGSNVHIYSCDITKLEEMKELFKQLRQEFGDIRGIIHSAGIAGDGFIIRKEEDTFRNVINPKIDGTFILDKLSQRDKLDFFIMCSSITSFMADAGQSDYTAANAYLNSFADRRNKQNKRTYSINWTAWKETGMAVDYNALEIEDAFLPITTQKATDSFTSILANDYKKVVVGEPNFGFIEENYNKLRFEIKAYWMEEVKKQSYLKLKQSKGNEFKKSNDIEIVGKSKDSLTETEIKVSNIWAEVLGMKRIDIYDSFYVMGGDSIMATQILKEMEEMFPNKIDISDIFTYTTAHDISTYIDDQDKNMNKGIVEDNKDTSISELLSKLAEGEIDIQEVSNRI